MIFDLKKIKNFYINFNLKINKIRSIINRPMTYSEKILFSHVRNIKTLFSKKKKDIYLNLFPDRVAMQDATAQMAILQFIQTKKNKVCIPSTIHCDHLIRAKNGYNVDLRNAVIENHEIYNFLKYSSYKYGIDFWNPGSGIIHQVILENYAFPGGIMIGADSHTPNAGGLGMLAIGVGGSEAAEAMAGSSLEIKFPNIVGVHLKGKINGWVSPKDVILKLSNIIGVSGGKNKIIEYFGKGTSNISCVGKATICNMGAEIGATSSLFPYDDQMSNYLIDNGREDILFEINKIKNNLNPDVEIFDDPYQYYNEVIEINLSKLEPCINGPFTPDKSNTLSNMKKEIQKNNWPSKIEVGLIGSCTNSSYSDLSKSISIILQAKEKNLDLRSEYFITPGSNKIFNFLKENKFDKYFEEIGGKIFSNACGPCIGQWDRKNKELNKKNTIIHSFNRNFSSRNDGNPNTFAFIASPEIVTALVFSGNLNFDPRKDYIKNRNGEYVKFESPKEYKKIKKNKKFFNLKELGLSRPKKGKIYFVKINKNSSRLKLLSPFSSWNGKDILNARLLIKVKGKCTTDHISMAGPWLKYRGNIEKISDNLLINALNFFNKKKNKVKNGITGEYDTVPNLAKYYKIKNIPSIIVGEENYGEGSSREHAAMEPRFLGIKVILAKSFARIHETNLKKQGILALTFSNFNDYYKIQEEDILNFYIKNFSFKKKYISIDIIHNNKKKDNIIAKHSYNENQIQWFKYGSSLNFISRKEKINI